MTKRILLLDSSFPLNSRNYRILEHLKNRYNVLAVTWDRQSIKREDLKGYRIFQKKSDYGNKLRKLLYLPKFYSFVKANVLDFKPDAIIASNWDMLVIAALIKIKYKTNLIYENRDMVSSKNIITKYIMIILEGLALSNTDSMIVASRFFVEKYRHFNGDIVVLENKVSGSTKIENHTNSDKLRISFIGTVRFFDIMKNLIDALKDITHYELNIYGEGPDKIKIEDYLYKNNMKNVKVHGEFKYSEIGRCYSHTDILWSGYPNTESSNKKYVIPNKYYESIYFGVPGIFPEKTKLGDLVENQDIGFVVDPYSITDIRKLLFKILNEDNILWDKVENMKSYKNTIIFESDVSKIEKLIGS